MRQKDGYMTAHSERNAIALHHPIFVTYFFTVLIIQNDEFRHVDFCDIEHYRACLPTHEQLTAHGITVLNPKDDTFVLLKDGNFLSARPEGTFGFANKANWWEEFRRLSSIPFKFVQEKPFSPHIPHIIHQTDNALHPETGYLENITSLKTMNKDWEYRYYSEKDRIDFIHTHYGWDVLSVYLRLNRLYGAAQADFFRYLCLYQHGGVYLDMKSGSSRPLSSIIRDDDQFIISQWDWSLPQYFEWGKKAELSHIEGGEFPIWCLICAPGHPLMAKVINQLIANIFLYTPNLHSTGSVATLKVTGPILFTRVVFNNLNKFDIRMENILAKGLNPHMVKNIYRKDQYHEQVLPLVIQSARVGDTI